MAVPIIKAGNVASLRKYVAMAIVIFGETEPFPYVINRTTGDITFIHPADIIDKDTLLEQLETLVFVEKEKIAREQLKDITFKVRNSSETYSVAYLVKPGEKIPLGYIAETILQAAIIARFVMREKNNSDITTKDVEEYVGAYINSTEKWSSSKKSKQVNKIVRFDAKNLGKPFRDKVVGYMSLNTGAYAYLEKAYKTGNLSRDALIGPFFKDSLSYVNKAEPKTHAWYFYTNGKIDLIEIESTSISGQAEGRKADIITRYREGYTGAPGSGKLAKFDLELSVKIKGTKQFGQATNIHLNSIAKFMSYVGVKLQPTVRKKIETIFLSKGLTIEGSGKTAKFLLKKKPVTAVKIQDLGVWDQVMAIMYEEMEKQVAAGGLDTVLSGVMDGIASKEEQERLPAITDTVHKKKSLPTRPGLSIVDIGEGANVYDVAKLLPYKLAKGKVTAKFKKTDNYKLEVFYEDKLLVTLSSRRIQNNFRNYIESGPELRKWMTRPD